MQTSFARGVAYWLASVVIMIRMTVTPLPIRPLLLLFRSRKRPILSVSLAEVQTIGMVFVVIPIVIVPVVAVVEPVAVLIVSMVFFLSSVVLLPGRSTHCRWYSKRCSKKKGTEKISIATVHVVFLLAQDFHLGILACKEYAFPMG
jgi:FlaA1/EpsC-like NDP-sugar epimerase